MLLKHSSGTFTHSSSVQHTGYHWSVTYSSGAWRTPVALLHTPVVMASDTPVASNTLQMDTIGVWHTPVEPDPLQWHFYLPLWFWCTPVALLPTPVVLVYSSGTFTYPCGSGVLQWHFYIPLWFWCTPVALLHTPVVLVHSSGTFTYPCGSGALQCLFYLPMWFWCTPVALLPTHVVLVHSSGIFTLPCLPEGCDAL